MPEAPLVYGRIGRRDACLRSVERLFGARPAGVRDVLFSRAPVFFPVVEEAFLFYVLASLFRAATGRRTAGVLFHPLPVVTSRHPVEGMKRALLRLLAGVRGVRTLTVLPFSIAPGLAAIATGWIYDFRFWDLTDEEREEVETLRALRRLNGRLVLSALGAQCRRRGFDLFAATYARFAGLRDRFQFISCGRIAPALAGHAAAFSEAGGVAVNREISEAELLGSYAASDAVWCLYPSPCDQALDIVGRAAQLGIPVVVERDSVIHRLCVMELIPHVAATAEEVADRLAAALPPRDDAQGRTMAARFAAASEAALRDALGL